MQDEQNLKDYLYHTAVDGVLFSLNLPNARLTRWMLGRVIGPWLSYILDIALEYDRMIETETLPAASAWISAKCGEPIQVNWADRVPTRGPVLLVANHPGYFEGMAITAQLPRNDLKVLVGGIPYFSKLPHMKEHIMYTDRSQEKNIQALRKVIQHLRSDGIVLIFPTGHADPDPDTMQGAHQRLEDWSESIALIMRRVPATRLVPVVVSGILEPEFLRHPLARRQKELVPMLRMAGFFQIYAQFKTPNRPPMSHPRVSFGEPVDGATLALQAGTNGAMPYIIKLAQDLLAQHLARR